MFLSALTRGGAFCIPTGFCTPVTVYPVNSHRDVAGHEILFPGGIKTRDLTSDAPVLEGEGMNKKGKRVVIPIYYVNKFCTGC